MSAEIPTSRIEVRLHMVAGTPVTFVKNRLTSDNCERDALVQEITDSAGIEVDGIWFFRHAILGVEVTPHDE